MLVSSRELMPLVKDALERGQYVHLTVTGISMRPFIYNGDVIELASAATFRRGDVVLVQTHEPGDPPCWILHRIVRFKGEDMFVMRGDAQSWCEGPFQFDRILGRVVKVRHQGHEWVIDRGLWRLAGIFWMYSLPLNLWFLRIAGMCRRLSRRLIKR